MWKHLEIVQRLNSAKDPILLVSVSTANPQFSVLYSQARELANYLLEKLEFTRLASFYSSALPAAISVSKEGVSDLVGVHFSLAKGNTRDIVMLAGYGSPTSDEYEFSAQILGYAKEIGVSEIVSVGARWNEEPLPPLETPRVLGFSSDEKGTEWLRNNGVVLIKSEPAYYFANTIICMAPLFGLRGYKLSVNHGEPRPHPKSLAALLEVLKKKLDFSIDSSDLQLRENELAEMVRTSSYQTNGAATRGYGEEQNKKDEIYR